MLRRSCYALLAVLFVQCASSPPEALVESWRKPGTVSFVFEKPAVIVLNGGPDLRKQLESQIAEETKGRVTPASSVLDSASMRSVQDVRRKLLDQGFDGLISMRLIRPTEIDMSASIPGETFTSYADSVPLGEPAYGEGKVLVETHFYRLSDEALIWRGVTEADPKGGPTAAVHKTVVTLRDELRRTGLVHD